MRRLQQASVKCGLDTNARWEIPPILVDHIGLTGESKSLVVIPGEFWLEVVSADTWEREIEEALSLAGQSESATPFAESPSR